MTSFFCLLFILFCLCPYYNFYGAASVELVPAVADEPTTHVVPFSYSLCKLFYELVTILRHRGLSLFGHVARLDPGLPAHDALRLTVDTYQSRKVMTSWRRPSGRPRNMWLNKVQEDANALPLSTLWRSEIATGSRRGATVTRTTRWRRK